jgi:hypothetical protein
MDMTEERLTDIQRDLADAFAAIDRTEYSAAYAELFGEEDFDETAILAFIDENPPKSGKAKYLPIGAILVAVSGEPYETLAMMGDKGDFREELRETWDITTREEALASLEWLLIDGQAEKYGEHFINFKTGKSHGLDAKSVGGYNDTVGAIADELPMLLRPARECGTLRGWDLERAGYLARVFTHLGWLAEDEAWDWIEKAAEELRDTFDTWESYIVSVLIGRGVASGFHFLPFGVACELIEEGRSFLDDHPVASL